MSERKFIKVNKALGKHAKLAFISTEHWPALVASLGIAILVGQVLGIADWQGQLLIFCGCFGTWIIAAGKNPKRFMAKFSTPPQWKRGRVLYSDPLAKKKSKV